MGFKVSLHIKFCITPTLLVILSGVLFRCGSKKTQSKNLYGYLITLLCKFYMVSCCTYV